ncbi:peptidyl-tRNA hydrolase [Sulfobacillus acidophilus TPY]|uniref:Peptidyl-tRNA hydrolase n=1 Tax=Sulfobacillus acidophilus (strain ATCC 700253 / DSM 10332 / NAL) TaxID=679936 RepID=G8TWA4_SULAD|nr:peptidyl-tRNA hydrolase [Sulfobacillus acidophilus TPY]AEW03747.1 Peptidyl-tRNA hydrolase [Sulfobacillus acidophilus DSM 10332]
MIRLIVGLGNPGPDYVNTRHNVGFMVLDAYARHRGLRFRLGRYGYLADSDQGWLMKPMTFMNLSGDAVGPFVRRYRLTPDQVLVVHDDLDLPLGRIRIRAHGSSGGHNGIKSIIQALGTDRFPRMRLGISRPPASMPVIDWVLAPFSADERRVLQDTIARAVEALDGIGQEGLEWAMSRYNG